jgi:hypothetical protein
MNKQNEKAELLEGIDDFSEETLSEMAMNAIEGGEDPDLYCGNNKGCTINNVAGCGCYG